MGITFLPAGQRLRWEGKGKDHEQRARLSCEQGLLMCLSQSAAAAGGVIKGGKKCDIYQPPTSTKMGQSALRLFHLMPPVTL